MLQLNDICKTYRKDGVSIRALAPINLTLQPGEFVAVQGASGSGKTTLLLIAGGLLHPDSGSVLIFGTDVYTLTSEQRSTFRSRNIGFVFQQYHLIPYLNVLENVLAPALAHPAADTKARALQLLQQFGLERRKNHAPAELSAGEKQRVALARALLFAPPLLLADEITGNLDAANAELVIDGIKKFAADGGAVLLVTHDTEAAKGTDRLVIMNNE
ncbi:ABC transporter ATP-binding protein [candidate division KSB1 bacterium]|nr:ABC transporter ATP-binding protein [candidate division KSB1 bacterium]RQW07721.1 MAG: ABC transporter ATP-binding protein [candidate division KSB1 bacterium]